MKRWPYISVTFVFAVQMAVIAEAGAPRWLSFAVMALLLAIVRVGYAFRE